jgi:hypothetical protein
VNLRNLIAAASVAIALTWAGTSLAATYYVSPAGSPTNPGSSAAPWNLSKANSTLQPGDVAILQPGNYGTATIAPARSGLSYATPITYRGNIARPTDAQVAGVTFTRFIHVQGLQVNSQLVFTTANNWADYIVGNSGAVDFTLGGDDCSVAHSSFTGSKVRFAGGPDTSPTAATVNRDTLYDCSFNLFMNDYGPAILQGTTDGLALLNSRFFVVIGPNGDHGTFKNYGGKRSMIRDCYFDFTNQRTTACDECGMGYFRDYATQNVFLRDTLLFRSGGGYNELMLTASGSYPGTVTNNRYDSCVWIQEEAPLWGIGAMYWQNGAQGDTVQNCTVIANSCTPIQMSGFSNNTVVRHNTFVQLGTGGSAGNTAPGGAFMWSSPCTVKDNIFYAPNSNSNAWSVDAGVLTNYRGDYNLAYSQAGASGSFKWGVNLTTLGTTSLACTGSGQECHSFVADPKLVGGTDIFAFDPHLRSGSPAIGRASDGGDLGAYPFGTGGTDQVRPAPIANLAVAWNNDHRVGLTWTSVGDDSLAGRATSYELKISSAPITNANFSAATTISTGLSPQPAGAIEQFAVSGLTASTLYYFAIRAVDDAANVGSVVNSLSVTTLAADAIAPARVLDLAPTSGP